MVIDSFNLSGKTALVTGASTGIGKGIALGLAEAGANIVGTYNSNLPNDIRQEVNKAGREFYGIKADLTLLKNVNDIIEKTIEKFGNLDILVNNAGTIIRSPAIEYKVDDWDTVININQKNLFFLCQAAAKQFLKQKSRGKIINIASMLSYQGGINVCSYTASKHAVVGITKILASEWAKYNINTNAIAPGWIATNMSAPLRENKERSRSIVSRIPAGDWGKPSDFKGVAVFLASEASNYINGVTIPVDGGYLVR